MSWLHDGHVGTHDKYALTCAEFDQLVLRAEGRCDRCVIPMRDPQIDHDHAIGGWAVRGLVCQSCNQAIDLVERGIRRLDAQTEDYLALAFYRELDPTGRSDYGGQHRHTNRNYRPADD